MSTFDEARQAVITALTALNTSYYPSLKVNWPNMSTVDIEHLNESFLSVEISFSPGAEMSGIGETGNFISGEMLVSYLRPTGKGHSGAAAYSDMLMANLCNRKLSGVTYLGIKVLDVSPYPGIVGKMSVVPFHV